MRALIAALLMGALVALGAIAPVAAAVRVPKVALIVGPVGPTITARYKALADDAARVARKHGAQVVKVYSPNATWPAVKKAITGASIVVYLGHGNGWPSRYRDELFPPSQNGFGLNPVAGVDDSAHQYFGEASVDDVKLAPNAVVLLHHLCYASGNTEPGLPEGTVDQAIQRVDNYAAGFLRAGARAVVAEAHMGPAWYVRNLLTTKQSIEKIWNRSPNAHGNTFRVRSERTPGYIARLDPDRSSGGYYRSLVSKGVTASDVRASATGSTNGAAVVAPPAEPSLANLSLRFGELSLATLPIAETSTTVTLPLSSGTPDRIPKGAQVGLRWDPVLLDAPLEPQQAVAQDPVTASDPAASPAASESPAPSPAASESPAPSPAASESPAPAPAEESASPQGYVAPRGMFTLPTDPAPEPSPPVQQRRTEVIIPTEPPAVDLVVPERIGSIVALGTLTRVDGGVAVDAAYPDAPGLYRLVPTLHTPSGEAYDAATQGLLTPVFVRVGGPVGVAYGAPASLELPALTTALLPVRVVNSGSEAWDAYVTTPPGVEDGKQLPNGRLTRLTATLTATWISAAGLTVPASSTAVLDPDISGPGADVAVTLGLEAPEAPGDYLLLLDVVSAAHGPLSALGSSPAIIRVSVTEPIPSPTPVSPQRKG